MSLWTEKRVCTECERDFVLVAAIKPTYYGEKSDICEPCGDFPDYEEEIHDRPDEKSSHGIRELR